MRARKAKPAWLPDWRDASAYPSRLSNAQWRWEFLRRRGEYQADFARCRPLFVDAFTSLFPDKPVPQHAASWGEHNGLAIMPQCRATYGTAGLLDPSQKIVPANLFAYAAAPFAVEFASQKVFDQWEQDGIRLIAFDLTKSLAPQLAKAKPTLRELQREHSRTPKVRQHRQKWATYLRALDADACGASASDISEILNLAGEANAEKRARDTLQQARLVSDGLTSPLKP